MSASLPADSVRQPDLQNPGPDQNMHPSNSHHKKPASMKETPHLGFSEEACNAISHGTAALALLFAMPFFSVSAWQQGGMLQLTGTAIFLICLILMFGGSCLYHIMPYDTQWKYIFRKLDHISILLAIAGTYTPICLVLIGGWLGWTVLAIEWAMVFFGILLKSCSNLTHPVLSMTIYMVMGWLAVFILPVLFRKACWQFTALIIAGGVFYTIGAFFFGSKKPYRHFIWHLFILMASFCHLIAIMCFMH